MQCRHRVIESLRRLCGVRKRIGQVADNPVSLRLSRPLDFLRMIEEARVTTRNSAWPRFTFFSLGDPAWSIITVPTVELSIIRLPSMLVDNYDVSAVD